MQNQNKNFNLSRKKLILILLITAIIGGTIIYAGFNLGSQALNSLQNKTTKQQSFNPLAPINNLFNQISEKLTPKQIEPIKVVNEESQVIKVVEEASPTVVSIVATAEVPTFETYYRDPFSNLPPGFEDFFNFGIPQRRQSGTEKRQIGAGTGFIVSSDGYIITNKHVVQDENAEYTVFLNNDKNSGEKITAKVLARDPSHDLAILKINKQNLPHLEFGDSDSLKVGQTAITIGYALGEFDNSVSKGVVSGLSRSVVASQNYTQEVLRNLIQTDAAINPGNSGGPMLDIGGKVIGVNVAMANAENIGFAIPANLAKKAYQEVKQTGTIQKQEIAFLGVRYLPVTENLQQKNNLPYDYGALVVRGEKREDLAVIPGSPADKAGIVENDIILEINGQKINSRNPLTDIIREYQPGDHVELKIFHKGEEKNTTLTLDKNK